MYKFIRKYQKRLLAVFAVGLMIAFTVQLGMPGAPPRGGDVVIGQIGADKVTLDQVRSAEAQWEFIARNLVTPTRMQPPQPQFASILQFMPQQLVQQVQARPELYFLLLEEARRMGITLDANSVRDFVSTNVAIQMPDRVIDVANASPQMRQNVELAVANLMSVLRAFERANDVVKVSQPMLNHSLVNRMQTMTVRAVEFSSSEFEAEAPQPTAEQLNEFFQRLASLPAGAVTNDANPLGFGYRYPNRIKLQYISIPVEQVRSVVRATKDDYAWELEARKYHLRNPQQFPSTQPATRPASAADQFSLSSPDAVAAGPTTRPFDEVRDEAIRRVMQPEIDRLTREIQSRIQNTLAIDYDTYTSRNPNPATMPAQPATQPVAIEPRTSTPSSIDGVPFESYDYLKTLAAKIQKEFGVLPTIGAVGEFMSQQQLDELEGIGGAMAGLNPFGRFAVGMAEPFVPPAQQKLPQLLGFFKPSGSLTDIVGNIYIFRITATDPSRAPKDVSEVMPQIAQDWKKQWAVDQAKAAALKLVGEARATTLDSAATARPILTVGPFDEFTPGPLQGLDLPSESAARFRVEAFRLLPELAKAPDSRPLRVIALPQAGKAFAVQVLSVETRPMPSNANLLLTQAAIDLRREFAQPIAMSWFNYQDVVNRLKFVDQSQRPADASN